MSGSSACLQNGPRLRPDNAVGREAAFLLKAGYSDVRFRSELPIHGETMTSAAQGTLDEDDIPSFEGRALQPELPDELGRMGAAAQCPIGGRADYSVRRKPVGTLESPYRQGRIASIDTIDTNREIMAPQESLEVDDARPFHRGTFQLQEGISAPHNG
jgi:hypothetical protein